MASRNARALSCCIVESAVYMVINKLGFSSMKCQQMMVITEFINNRDMFVARFVIPLPTGVLLAFQWSLTS